MNADGKLLFLLIKKWVKGERADVARRVRDMSPVDIVAFTRVLYEEYRIDTYPHLGELMVLLRQLDAQ